MIRRRRTLQAAALAAAAAWPAVAAAAADPVRAASPTLLAWGEGGAWLLADGLAQALPAAQPPAAAAAAVWSVDAAGLVQRWRPRAATGGEPALPAAAPWIAQAAQSIGEPVHGMAASADGAHALLAHGQRLTLLDAGARPLKVYQGEDLARTRRGRAQALFAHAGRASLLVAWSGFGELWEIPLDPRAPPIFDGLVHDYRMGEALPRPGYLGVRRVPLEGPPPRFVLADPRVPWVAGLVDGGVAVVHLDVRRRIATLPLAGARPQASALPQAGRAGAWWLPAGEHVFVVDTARWRVASELPAPAGLLRLHDADGALWALAEAGLLRWQPGGWQTVAALGGAPRALARDERRRHWLAAVTPADAAAPGAVLRLDDEGRLLARVALPAGARVDGLAALG
ncbi:MAG: hypothetical protein HYZ20_17340 [Burkholderiales bacterium]|nr:hypothetical protein [Burkholderiales bacterium]